MRNKFSLLLLIGLIVLFQADIIQAQTKAIHAGGVLDPADGSVAENQWIVTEGDEIIDIGENISIPDHANVIDLSDYIVMPGLMDSHTHLAWHINHRKNDGYVLSIVRQPTAYRALQGAMNARDMLMAGFTTVRDVGNAANYADTALRMAVEDSLIIGPNIYNAGRIIAPFGGQRWVIPERRDYTQPEYFFADTKDELKKAIRENIHFGAKWIKLVVDDQKYIYSAEDIRFVVEEAGRAGVSVAAHTSTDRGARNAIEAGVETLEHGFDISRETLQLLAEKEIPFVSTTFSLPVLKAMESDLSSSPVDTYHYMVDILKMAREEGVTVAFGSDVITWVPGMNRGEATLSYIESFEDAGFKDSEILRVFTVNNIRAIGLENKRGKIEKGWKADIIALSENPAENISALKNVAWVMINGTVVKNQAY